MVSRTAYAFLLMPVSGIILNCFVSRNGRIVQRDEEPVTQLINNVKKAVGVQPTQPEVPYVDLAAPLLLIGGASFPKTATLLGWVYLAGKFVQRRPEREVGTVGTMIMQFSLLPISMLAFVSIIFRIATKP